MLLLLPRQDLTSNLNLSGLYQRLRRLRCISWANAVQIQSGAFFCYFPKQDQFGAYEREKFARACQTIPARVPPQQNKDCPFYGHQGNTLLKTWTTTWIAKDKKRQNLLPRWTMGVQCQTCALFPSACTCCDARLPFRHWRKKERGGARIFCQMCSGRTWLKNISRLCKIRQVSSLGVGLKSKTCN